MESFVTVLALLLSALTVLLADQATKRLLAAHVPAGQIWRATRLITIKRVDGGAGRASRWGRWPWLILWTGCVLGLALSVWYSGRGGSLPVALGAAIGGATGNLVDRLGRGYVVDFIAVGPWPVFNVADAAITCGTLTALWLLV